MTLQKRDFIGQRKALLSSRGSISILAIRDKYVAVAEGVPESEKDIRILKLHPDNRRKHYFTVYGMRFYLNDFMPLCTFLPYSVQA